jgi:hypothetical protein
MYVHENVLICMYASVYDSPGWPSILQALILYGMTSNNLRLDLA